MKTKKTIVILDFGSQYTQLIARRIRKLGVYSAILPCYCSQDDVLKLDPAGIILSGGPASIYDRDAPQCVQSLFEIDVPFLGICYGMHILTHIYGGNIIAASKREYGDTPVKLYQSALFSGIKKKEITAWM
ncbi:MAG TPA: GMP synthase (glutamine-hydrolyzing), partial [Spirochaetota bacterium]|nr:GMP synthase (glutamine-hydrolyzing) [Spirochaetota bacterium]